MLYIEPKRALNPFMLSVFPVVVTFPAITVFVVPSNVTIAYSST